MGGAQRAFVGRKKTSPISFSTKPKERSATNLAETPGARAPPPHTAPLHKSRHAPAPNPPSLPHTARAHAPSSPSSPSHTHTRRPPPRGNPLGGPAFTFPPLSRAPGSSCGRKRTEQGKEREGYRQPVCLFFLAAPAAANTHAPRGKAEATRPRSPTPPPSKPRPCIPPATDPSSRPCFSLATRRETRRRPPTRRRGRRRRGRRAK